jgi:putative ribosome biogenesis GTPase RsgA
MNCTSSPQLMEWQNLSLQTGEVKLIANRSYWVEIAKDLHQASKAFGCVIEPKIGDTVLLYADSSDRYYILSILARESDTRPEMVFDKGVSIKAPEGELRIDAQRAMVNIEQVMITGSMLLSKWDKVKTVAKSIEASADRWIQRLIRSYRFVEEFEESKINRLRYLVKGMCSIKSKKTSIISEESVKIDGSKIMLG